MLANESRHLLQEALYICGGLEPHIGERSQGPQIALLRDDCRRSRLDDRDQDREIEMGVCRQIPNDRADGVVGRALVVRERDGLTDRIARREIPLCRLFGQHGVPWRLKSIARACRQLQPEEIEKTRIDGRDILCRPDAVADHTAIGRHDIRADELGIGLLEHVEQPPRRLITHTVERATGQVEIALHHVEIFMVRNPAIVAGLEPDIETENDEHGDADRQTTNIERGVELVPGERAIERKKGEAVHGRVPVLGRFNRRRCGLGRPC